MESTRKGLGIILAFIFLVGCSSGPRPIKIGVDNCDFCKMGIADNHFGGEIVTKKGKVYKFDDTHCLSAFRTAKMDSNAIKEIYFVNYKEPHNFIESGKALFLRSEGLHSPMGGNTAVFDNENELKQESGKVSGEIISLQDLLNQER